MKPRNISLDRKGEKQSAVRSVIFNTLLQLIVVGILLYLRSVTGSPWLRGLLLFLAGADLVTIPFTFAALWQRVREIEKGELDEARRY